MFHPGMGFGLFGLGMVASPHVHAVHSKGVCQGRHPLCLRLQTVVADVSTCGDAGSNVGVGSSLPVRRMRTPGQLASWIKNSPAVCMKVKTKQGQLSCIRCVPFQFYRPPCAGPMGYPLTRWCGGIAWYGWIPSDPDRIIVPWIRLRGWGLVTPNMESPCIPDAVRFNLIFDPVSRPCEKKCAVRLNHVLMLTYI